MLDFERPGTTRSLTKDQLCHLIILVPVETKQDCVPHLGLLVKKKLKHFLFFCYLRTLNREESSFVMNAISGIMALDLFSAVKGSLFHGDAINIDNLVRVIMMMMIIVGEMLAKAFTLQMRKSQCS